MSGSNSSTRSRVSAGILMFRRHKNRLEILLVHPGGPFFAKKDLGAWSIPKGEAGSDEDLLTRAQIEFEEEVGVPAHGNFVELGSIKQKGGKKVHAWAVEHDLGENLIFRSNTFELEWPPHSGKQQKFPEIDQAAYFSEEVAREKINPAQIPFLDRVRDSLKL